MSPWLLISFAALLSYLLTGALRRYALARSIIDIPNARSSHSIPTPRGGGGAIVLSYLLTLPVFALVGVFPWTATWAILGAGAGIAVLGFLDDHGHIAARWRLLGHLAASIWALYWLDGMSALTLFGFNFELGRLGYVLATLYLV